MLDLTKPQKEWLMQLRAKGFLEAAAWGDRHRNQILDRLVALGLADFGPGPDGTKGYMPTKEGMAARLTRPKARRAA